MACLRAAPVRGHRAMVPASSSWRPRQAAIRPHKERCLGLAFFAALRLRKQIRRACRVSIAGEDLNVTESRFCHGWSISQLREGYRYCADDILCAYLACKAAPEAKRMLDLGSGIGTIGLVSFPSHSPQQAQEVSVALCRRTLRQCQVEDVVDLRHGDLRDQSVLHVRRREKTKALGKNFDVVTANPPYFTSTCGNLPKNQQKAHCRHELRGGVLQFCSAAAHTMAPGASFCLIHATPRMSDVLAALERCRFAIRRRVDVLWRGNCKSVALVCSLGEPKGQPAAETLQVQEPDGRWSPAYLDICAEMGL
ncbi:unnamed protein product [Effrenium voratum]|nr:unnamed protein product [Effrenium voratum]